MTKTDEPRYRVIAPTYLGTAYHIAGDGGPDGIVWDGAPNAALEPVNAAAEKRVAEYEADKARRSEAARVASSPSGVPIRKAVADTAGAEKERDTALARAEKAEDERDELRDERDGLKTQVAELTAARDALQAQVAKFDGDGDGSIGGSNPNPTADVTPDSTTLADGKENLAPAPQTVDVADDRAAIMAKLDAKKVKYFKGTSTDKLKEKLAAS